MLTNQVSEYKISNYVTEELLDKLRSIEDIEKRINWNFAQGGTKLMELIFCGKRVARAVLVLQKYCMYFRYFVGICSNLVCTSRLLYSFPWKISNLRHCKEQKYCICLRSDNAGFKCWQNKKAQISSKVSAPSYFIPPVVWTVQEH